MVLEPGRLVRLIYCLPDISCPGDEHPVATTLPSVLHWPGILRSNSGRYAFLPEVGQHGTSGLMAREMRAMTVDTWYAIRWSG